MKTVVLSASPSFERHLHTALGSAHYDLARTPEECLELIGSDEAIVLIHKPSFGNINPLISSLLGMKRAPRIGIASDTPNVVELIHLASKGIKAYFNSYMADIHYAHMLQILMLGQQWFAPQLQNELLTMAAHLIQESESAKNVLESLTSRELQIAQAVADGLSNKKIAAKFSITERTVKAHLTKCFAKLGIESRLALATLILNSQQPEMK